MAIFVGYFIAKYFFVRLFCSPIAVAGLYGGFQIVLAIFGHFYLVTLEYKNNVLERLRLLFLSTLFRIGD